MWTSNLATHLLVPEVERKTVGYRMAIGPATQGA